MTILLQRHSKLVISHPRLQSPLYIRTYIHIPLTDREYISFPVPLITSPLQVVPSPCPFLTPEDLCSLVLKGNGCQLVLSAMHRHRTVPVQHAGLSALCNMAIAGEAQGQRSVVLCCNGMCALGVIRVSKYVRPSS